MTAFNYFGQQYSWQNQNNYNLSASATPQGALATGNGDNIQTIATSTQDANIALAADKQTGAFAFAYDGILGKMAQSFPGNTNQNSTPTYNNYSSQFPLASTVPIQNNYSQGLDQNYSQLQQNFAPVVGNNNSNTFQPQQMMQMFQQIQQFMNFMMQMLQQMMGGMFGGNNFAYNSSNNSGYNINNSGNYSTPYSNNGCNNSTGSTNAYAYSSPQGSWASASSSGNTNSPSTGSTCNNYIAPLENYNGSSRTGQMLANAAANIASQRNSVGKCYRGVKEALCQIGVNVSGISAWQAGNQLASNPRFKEVKVNNSQDLANLPPGAVVVWGQTPQSPHGHISIALGNGQEASDHISKQLTDLRGAKNYRVFLPS